jgi:peptide/nickel transport system substrate-binding protein
MHRSHTTPVVRSGGRRRALMVALAAALVVAACGGNSPDASETTTPPTVGGTPDPAEGGDDSDEADVTTTAPPSTAPLLTSPPTTTDPTREPTRGGVLRVALDAESAGYNPHRDAWAASGNVVARSVFDSLAVFDEGGIPVPYLAETIEPNDDATVWTITLRDGITFHNGEALDAEVVRLNFETALESPQLAGQLAPVERIEVIDGLTVRVEMREPWATFPNVLVGDIGAQVGYMVAPEMIGRADGGRAPIGSGPFRFVEWVSDDRFVVERNDDYWMEPAFVDQIVFRPIPDTTSRQAAFDAGDVDVYVTASTNQIVEYLAAAERDEVKVSVGAPSEPDIIVFNTQAAPLDDVRVRRALVMATDIPRIFDYLDAVGVKQPLRGPYDESSFWYVESDYPDYDPDGARALIDEVTAELGPVEFEFAGGQDPFIVGYQELFQSMWAEIGVRADIVSLAQGENVEKALTGDFQVMLWGGVGGGDPDNDFDTFHSGPLNFARFETPEIDAAMLAGRSVGDPDLRREQYAIVQRALGEAVPYLWVGTNQFAMITTPAVNGGGTFVLPDGSPGQGILGGRYYLKDVWVDG